MNTIEFVREIWLTIEKLNRSCVSRGGHSTQVVGRGGGEVGKLHNRGASVVLVGAESAIGTNRRRSNQQPSGAAERLDPKHLKIRQIYFSEWTDTIFNLDKSNFGQYKKPLSAQIAATASNILAAAARRASFSSGTNNQMMMEEPHLRP